MDNATLFEAALLAWAVFATAVAINVTHKLKMSCLFGSALLQDEEMYQSIRRQIALRQGKQ